MILYGLKTCDTCRKALKSLPDAQFVDVRTKGVPGDVLTRALTRFGAKLVNARSTTWRELSQSERKKPEIELLQTYPTLMKRPLIVSGDQMWIGWAADTQAALSRG